MKLISYQVKEEKKSGHPFNSNLFSVGNKQSIIRLEHKVLEYSNQAMTGMETNNYVSIHIKETNNYVSVHIKSITLVTLVLQMG